LRETTDKINAELIGVYGTGQRAEYEDITPEDKTIEMAEINLFAKFHTVDEVRVEKFGNDPDPDSERGALFVSQVTATTGQSMPEPIAPIQPQPIDTPPVIDNNAQVKAALMGWKRYALRTFGKSAKQFENDNIPARLRNEIEARLGACKSAGDVADVFENAIKAEYKPQTDNLLQLAAAINKAAVVVVNG
jgi:hypothetical protein